MISYLDKTKERTLQTKVNNLLTNRGYFHLHISDKFVSGIPDIFAWKDGRSYAIELKVGKNKPSKLQLYFLNKLAQQGVITGVCYSVAEVKEILKGGDKNGS